VNKKEENMSDAKTSLYNNPALQNRAQTANTWEGAYNQAVTSYLGKDYLKARSLLNMIRKQYTGKYNEKQIAELESKIKSRIGL
jgi:hypothetical protein